MNSRRLLSSTGLLPFGYSGVGSTPLGHSLILADVLPLFESDDFRSLTGSPPFRPPRVWYRPNGRCRQAGAFARAETRSAARPDGRCRHEGMVSQV